MRVLTQWVLDSYPIVYIDKKFKQHPLCVYCSLDSVLLLRSFQSLAERTNRVFCSVSKYITDCYLITYCTNNSFEYLVGYLLFQLLKKPCQYWPERSDPDPSCPPSWWCFGQNAQEASECDVHYWHTWVQNPTKRRSDALRAFARWNRQYSLYWNQLHNPFHGWRIRLIDFTYWFVLN